MPSDEGSESALLDKVESALDLVAIYDHRRFNRLAIDLKYIWVTSFNWGNGHYHPGFDVCHLYDQFVTNPNVSPSRVASTIVHEGIHARLSHAGILYRARLRSRIERACTREQLAFANRLPDGGAEIARLEAVVHAQPKDLSSERLQRGYHTAGEQWLLSFGVPRWLARVLLGRRAA